MRIFIFVFALLFSCISWSQKAHFRAFSTIDGLPQSQVVSIKQDSLGYLWIGTLGGVAKFNGGTFENYTISNGLFNNRVSLIETIGGNVYVGHEGGVSFWVKNKFKPIEIPNTKERSPVTAIVRFDGKIIVSTNGAGVYEFKNGALIKINTGSKLDFVRGMVVFEDKLIIAGYDRILETQDFVSYHTVSISEDLNIIELFSYNNKIYVGTYLNGLYSFSNPRDGLRKEAGTDGYRINKIAVNQSGWLTIATSQGLLEQHANGFELKTVENGLPMNNLTTVFSDRSKSVWIGTNGKGLILAPNQHVRYFDKQSGLPTDIVISIVQKENKEYVFGSIDSYIHSTFDFKTFRSEKVESPPWVLINDVDGRFWYRSENGLTGIDVHGNVREISEGFGAPGQRVTAIYKIDKNQMYVGTSQGVVLYNKGLIENLAKENQFVENVRAIYPINNKEILVGTDNGLYKLKEGNYTRITALRAMVFSIVKLRNGRVFIGTEEGIYEYKENEIIRLDFARKIASNYINFLIPKGNDLVAGTNNGLVILRFVGLDFKILRLTKNHGLIDLETNINSAFFDLKDNLWFGTASGLVRLDYNKFVTETQNVKLVFNNILLNYKRFSISEFGGITKNGLPTGLHFPHNKNNLQFLFDVIALKDYDNVSLQFFLEGHETDWSPLTKSTSVSYSGLQPGNYSLRVRLVSEEGVVMESIKLTFGVDQAYYKSWWFMLFVVGCSGLILWFFIHQKIKREKIHGELEKAEMRTRLVQLEQQSLNASMNRHFIFNALNSIQYFINISDKRSANRYLSSFAKLIRKNLDSSSDDENRVTLDQEVERLELYLSLEAMRFNGLFEYEIICDAKDAESIRIPAMMVQPFIENSIIHGVLPQRDVKGMITVSFVQKGTDLLINIRDNGIGIDKSFENKQQNNGDHKSRGMEITMKRIDLIRKISEENLFIDGPKQISAENGDVLGTEVSIIINNIELDI